MPLSPLSGESQERTPSSVEKPAKEPDRDDRDNAKLPAPDILRFR